MLSDDTTLAAVMPTRRATNRELSMLAVARLVIRDGPCAGRCGQARGGQWDTENETSSGARAERTRTERARAWVRLHELSAFVLEERTRIASSEHELVVGV